MKKISRVPVQNSVSQAWYMVEIHHSGWEPLICADQFICHVCAINYICVDFYKIYIHNPVNFKSNYEMNIVYRGQKQKGTYWKMPLLLFVRQMVKKHFNIFLHLDIYLIQSMSTSVLDRYFFLEKNKQTNRNMKNYVKISWKASKLWNFHENFHEHTMVLLYSYEVHNQSHRSPKSVPIFKPSVEWSLSISFWSSEPVYLLDFFVLYFVCLWDPFVLKQLVALLWSIVLQCDL